MDAREIFEQTIGDMFEGLAKRKIYLFRNCPICGGTNVELKESDGKYTVECNNCVSSRYFQTKDEAVKYWNETGNKVARLINADELGAQLHLMSACAGSMSGPAVIQWVLRTVEEMAGEKRDE